MPTFEAGRSGLSYVVAVDGLSALRDLETIPDRVKRAAQQAVNKTVRRTRTDASRRIRREVNFPARYLDDQERGNLYISKRATEDDIEARITGRFRPTSLARFVKSGRPGGAGKRPTPVTLQVEPGLAKRSRRMFLIKLRRGTADIAEGFNLGLAIRLKPGERVENKKKMIQVSKGLYLLYGPSVNQVFANVAEDVAPDAAEYLEAEFTRLMGLDRA